MVARDGVEPPTPAFSDNLSDSWWPPKSLRSRERHTNRGLESWVQKNAQKNHHPASAVRSTRRGGGLGSVVGASRILRAGWICCPGWPLMSHNKFFSTTAPGPQTKMVIARSPWRRPRSRNRLLGELAERLREQYSLSETLKTSDLWRQPLGGICCG